MGNFSQDPDARAADAIARHYVGVRLQQAVPLLDADWNLLEDLRRRELETIGRAFLGDGVPVGSDGFHVTAVGQSNDFAIAAGLYLVGGKLTRNDAPVRYTTQPNFGNPALADPPQPLVTPVVARAFLAVLDVWEREVDADEDAGLVDGRIGVETAVRVKREWAVRVVRDPEDVPALASPPPGHAYVVLARLARLAGNPTITQAMITDLRDTQLTLLRRVEARNGAGNVVVDNFRFALMLVTTRNNALAFVRYITTKFNAIFAVMSGAEVLGLEAAAHVAHTAQAGLAQLGTLSMANRGALSFLRQLHGAEQSFLEVWRDVVLQLGTAVKKYASYKVFIENLEKRLNDPVVLGLTGLLPALDAEDLPAAVEMQEEIARTFGAAAENIARGSIQVAYASGPPGTLATGVVVRLEFRVRSFTTQADSFTVAILPEQGWPRVLVDGAGNPIPNNKISVGAAGSQVSVFVNVTPQAGTSQLQLRVRSDSNPAEIDQFTGVLTLAVGQPAPPPEDRIQLSPESLFRATINPATGVVTVSVPPAPQPAQVGIRIFNNSGQQATFAIAVDVAAGSQLGAWTVERAGADTVTLASGANDRVGGINITATATSVSVQARYTVTATVLGQQITATIVVPIVVG